jgi:hypothetical protein
MKKIAFIAIACLIFGIKITAQENQSAKSPQGNNDIYTGIKPPDGRAYVYGSKEEKEKSIAGKKSNVIEQIKKNQSDPEKVNLLRMELWRIENGTVAERKTENK